MTAAASKGRSAWDSGSPCWSLSPYARGGFLCSETFDHTSLLRFLETRFGVEVPNLSEWRRQNTGDLTKAFNFVKGDTGKGKLPTITVSKSEETTGACETDEPLKPPPNSLPAAARGGQLATPSG